LFQEVAEEDSRRIGLVSPNKDEEDNGILSVAGEEKLSDRSPSIRHPVEMNSLYAPSIFSKKFACKFDRKYSAEERTERT